MSGFPIVDLVIGMIFIYFLLSIICSSAVELLFSLLKTRAALLEAWLLKIFDRPALDSQGNPLKNSNGSTITLGQAIMDHCMTTALSAKGKSTSYIGAKNFVSAFLDKITLHHAANANASTQLPPTDLPGYIKAISNSDVISGELKRTILSYAHEAQLAYDAAVKLIPGVSNAAVAIKSEMEHFRERLEDWYNTNSDRLSGTLKRKKVLPATIVIATILTITLNVNTVTISRYLYDHKEKAKEFSEKALSSLDNYKERISNMKSIPDTAKSTDPVAIAKLDSNLSQVKQDIADMKAAVPSDLPIGWPKADTTKSNGSKGKSELRNGSENTLTMIFGWLATIFAICLGAPFWFDILNKIANLRGTGPKPSTSTSDDGKK